MSLLYPWSDYLSDLRRIRFLCLPKPARRISLLDFHATGLTLRVGAAVTAIAAALPSYKVLLIEIWSGEAINRSCRRGLQSHHQNTIRLIPLSEW